ncbi:MAG: DUF1538 domain-containing protein [Clostridiales bacterium]|nr:DUF1538 domain-containing protein [Clostridiales bacterium]PWM21477.1 MAG: DUF1538 domain-containing protein [Clostridiales bacterium]
MLNNRSKLREKALEALSSVLPITAIVLLLCFTISPIPSSMLLAFVLGAALLIVGMALFTLGADTAMAPIGSKVGASITKSKKLWLILLVSLLLGIIITISEPDLQILANQVPGIPDAVLIGAVAVGVGVFLVIAMLRILIGIRLSYLLIGFYAIVFILAFFVPKNFWAIAFDAGGVTTGPMTVPFIMALGVGVSSIRSDRHAGDDSFGLVALSSIGPVIAVLVLGLLYPTQGTYIPVEIPDMESSRTLAALFLEALPDYMKEVGFALAPILVFFLIFDFFVLKMGKRPFFKILIGIIYTYVGLVLFLTGVNVGFMPVGNYVGKEIASLDYNWVLIPISMIVGYFIVAAEPAVHVLNKQVEEITAGSIPARAMRLSLSAGVAVSLALAMVRVLTGISIMWFLLPGYIAALALTFFVPKIFTAIAFDSGGVASGTMTATFLLSFAMGACEIIGGTDRIVTDAFGVVALVAMTPLITIQILGLAYNLKLKRREAEPEPQAAYGDDDIIEL